ncbi:MAG: histidine phosphatase family protein [Ruminococcus sp.]|nr:histidine phosphatase family protein [Ruminococcus sp.]MBQ8298036.1 histidine phosphatase family protein [Ruminococcus sp.]
MKIYSTRHGQTDYNKKDFILGITDLELNETGLSQAKQLAEEIKNSGIKLDIIISSPMKRALKTAQLAAELNSLELVTDERLREWDYGKFEGLHRTAEGFAENKREFGVRMGETGESLLQLSHRVYSVLDEVIEKYKGKNVLLVSHGGICRVIETYFNNMTTAEYSNWFMGNCQLIEYDLGD